MTPLYLLSILLMSFWGSWHCAAMCGPISCRFHTKTQQMPYQLGRLISYMMVGALAGFAGNQLIPFNKTAWMIAVSLCFLVLAVNSILLFRPHLQLPTDHPFVRNLSTLPFLMMKRLGLNHAFGVGILTGLLPCSWLFMFYMAAAVAASPMAGALVMSMLWLGSVPALYSASLFFRKTLEKTPLSKRRIAVVCLNLASLYAVVSHGSSLF